jgi:hypothetical protein
MPVLALFAWSVLSPKPLRAIPAFARRYNVKCYNCHTIPPVLNKTGYMFKRLGYRMPPDDMDGTKPAPKISELDPEIRFSVTNSLALVTDTSFTQERTNDGVTRTSNTSFNLAEAALFLSASVPQTNFSYFAQYELYQDGESFLEQANAIYTGGRANSSYFGKVGEMHLQEGEGTRAAMLLSLFPEPALLLGNSNALNYTLDQHPVGVGGGYTWASHYFKQILAVSGKVTNGLNADGSEILSASTKNSKDYWFDADYWFGPDGGVTFNTVYASKDQIQNPGLDSEFTYRPTIRRYGIHGNYLFFDKLDILGGYLHGRDDWQDMANGAVTNFTTNGLRGEVDYYFVPGFAVMGRYDQLNETIEGTPTTRSSNWGVGTEKALTKLGNVIIRGTYNQLRAVDPVSQTTFTDKVFEIDFRLMW